MLTRLLALLDQRGYAPSTRRRYGVYIWRFATWCAARGLTRLPTSAQVLSAWLRSLRRPDPRYLTALDAVFEQAGLRRPSTRADLAEVIVLLGLRARRSSPTPPVRLRAQARSASTAALYQRRIARFRRWCARLDLAPGADSLDRWIRTLPVSAATRAQYRTSIRAWAQMPAPTAAPRPAAPEQPAPLRAKPRRPIVLRTAEKRLLYQLSRTGVAEHHRHAQGLARVRVKRLSALTRAGFLEVNTGIIIEPATRRPVVVRYYSLGRRGRRWLEQQGVQHVYRWNPQQLRHDLQLTDVYWQLPPAIQRTWLTETEIIAQLRGQRRFNAGEAVDAAIVIDGAPYAIEVAVGYSPAALARKRACIRDVFGGRGLLIT